MPKNLFEGKKRSSQRNEGEKRENTKKDGRRTDETSNTTKSQGEGKLLGDRSGEKNNKKLVSKRERVPNRV